MKKYKIIEHNTLKTVQKSDIYSGDKWHLCHGDSYLGLCRNKHKDIHLYYFTDYFNITDRETRLCRKIFVLLHELGHALQYTDKVLSKKYNEIKKTFNKNYGEYTHKDYKWIEDFPDEFALEFMFKNVNKINEIFNINLRCDEIQNLIK